MFSEDPSSSPQVLRTWIEETEGKLTINCMTFGDYNLPKKEALC